MFLIQTNAFSACLFCNCSGAFWVESCFIHSSASHASLFSLFVFDKWIKMDGSDLSFRTLVHCFAGRYLIIFLFVNRVSELVIDLLCSHAKWSDWRIWLPTGANKSENPKALMTYLVDVQQGEKNVGRICIWKRHKSSYIRGCYKKIARH